MKCPSFSAMNFNGKRVFLRADLNVPIMNGIIKNDHRIRAIVPTIDAILKQGGKIILAKIIGEKKVAVIAKKS